MKVFIGIFFGIFLILLCGGLVLFVGERIAEERVLTSGIPESIKPKLPNNCQILNEHIFWKPHKRNGEEFSCAYISKILIGSENVDEFWALNNLEDWPSNFWVGLKTIDTMWWDIPDECTKLSEKCGKGSKGSYEAAHYFKKSIYYYIETEAKPPK